MADLIGITFGHYTILEQIGHGGMATVYRATDLSSSRPVALKILSPYLAAEEQFRTRFRREVEILRELRHPNIVPIEEYGEHRSLAYIVMPYFRDGTLQDRMKKGPVTPQDGARLVTQVCLALDFAHRHGVIHRDVKPSNILMDADRNALLADFGFAHLPDSTSNLTGSLLIGTPAYMSPEQCCGESIDARSDQYSFGVVLYELTTGRLPYEADTPMGIIVKHASQPLPAPRAVNPNLPEPVEVVLVKALAKSPADRFESMAALDHAFQQALAESLDRSGIHRPTAAVPAAKVRGPTAVRSTQGTSRRKWLLGAAIAGLIILIGVPAAFALSGQPPRFLWSPGPPPTSTAMFSQGLMSSTAGDSAAGGVGHAGAWADEEATDTPGPSPAVQVVADSGSDASPTPSPSSTGTVSPTSTWLPASATQPPTETPPDTDTPIPSATQSPSATPTASQTPTETGTATVTPTATQDCSMIAVGSTYVSLGKIVVMSVRNLNPVTIYLTDSSLDWTDAYHPGQYVDWMQWRGTSYYAGDSYDPPTIAGPAPPRAFPSGTTQLWRAGFGGVPAELGLDGTFTVRLTFNAQCTVLGSVTRHAPTLTATTEPTAAPTETATATISTTP